MLKYWDNRHETTVEQHCPGSGVHAILAERTGYGYRDLELGWDRGRWRARCKVSRGQKAKAVGLRSNEGSLAAGKLADKRMIPTDFDGAKRNEQAAGDRVSCGCQRWDCCCLYRGHSAAMTGHERVSQVAVWLHCQLKRGVR